MLALFGNIKKAMPIFSSAGYWILFCEVNLYEKYLYSAGASF